MVDGKVQPDTYIYQGKTYKTQKDENGNWVLMEQLPNGSTATPAKIRIDGDDTGSTNLQANEKDATGKTAEQALQDEVEKVKGDTEADPLFQFNGQWYQLLPSTNVDTGGTNDAKYTYTAQQAGGKPAVGVHLADYWVGNNEDSREETGNTPANGGINDGHELKFSGGGFDPKTDTKADTDNGFEADNGPINQWTGDGQDPNLGILKPNLVGGFPELAGGSQESLKYLFGQTNQTKGIKWITDPLGVDGDTNATNDYGLLDYDQNTKQYHFDSRTQTKQLVRGGNDFRFENAGGNQFFPLDQIDPLKNGGNNHWFGMSINFQYNQPKDGKIDGKDMTFSFSGDDDFWLYIDGKLALDLGGIHDAAKGTIDFANGEVDGGNLDKGDMKEQRNLKTAYNGALLTPGPHTINIFYLERGNHDSNLSLNFNLQTQQTFYARKVGGKLETASNKYEYWEHYLHLPKLYTYNPNKLPKYKVSVKKIDSTTGAALQQAGFTLTKNGQDDAKIGETDTQGMTSFSNLNLADSYTLTESNPPAGYDELRGKITFNLARDAEGNLQVTNLKQFNPDGAQVTNNVAVTASQEPKAPTAVTLTVKDHPTPVLPHTGGPGDRQLLVTALSMLGIAVCLTLIVMLKRREVSDRD